MRSLLLLLVLRSGQRLLALLLMAASLSAQGLEGGDGVLEILCYQVSLWCLSIHSFAQSF